MSDEGVAPIAGAILADLARCPRFDFVSMCLSPSERKSAQRPDAQLTSQSLHGCWKRRAVMRRRELNGAYELALQVYAAAAAAAVAAARDRALRQKGMACGNQRAKGGA